MKRVLFFTLLVLCLAGLFLARNRVAGAAAPKGAIPIEFTAGGIVVAEELEGGLVTLEFINAGEAPQIPLFARLKEGETPESFAAAGEGGLALLSDIVSAGFLPPGARGSVIAELKPGTWLAMDELNHATRPSFVTVTEGNGDGTSVPVDAPVIEMVNFGFRGIPATTAAGPVTWKLVNEGTQPHEVALFRLNDGVTPEAFIESAMGPAPLGVPAGTAVAAPGGTVWKSFTLEAGTYLAACFVPDTESGAPHVALGMQATFTVPGAPATMPATGGANPWYLTLLGWGAVSLLAGLTLRAILVTKGSR